MPAFIPQRYEQILQRMLSKVVSRTNLSDITDASVMKHLLAAPARELDEAYFQMTNLQSIFSLDSAQGDDLDQRAREIAPGDLLRASAVKATGTVEFSRSGTSGTVAIAIGTKVKTSDGVEFVTTAAGSIIDTASTSGNVAAIAVVAGAAGNVAAGTVNKFDTKPAGVDTVTNNTPFTQGVDRESDDAFRNRIREYISTLSRSTPRALEFIATQVALDNGQRVKTAHVVEDTVLRGEVTLYIDDGAGTAETSEAITGEIATEGLAGPPPDTAVGGETFLYLNEVPVKTDETFTVTSDARGVLVLDTDFTLEDAGGQLAFDPVLSAAEEIDVDYSHYTGLIQEVQKVVDGDPNDRENYPGYRGAGVRVRVRSPAVVVQEVTAVLAVAEGYAESDVFAEVEEVILEYLNNLGISGDVVRAKITERIMSVAGVYNVSITEPTSDVAILDDEVARSDSANITLT